MKCALAVSLEENVRPIRVFAGDLIVYLRNEGVTETCHGWLGRRRRPLDKGIRY